MILELRAQPRHLRGAAEDPFAEEPGRQDKWLKDMQLKNVWKCWGKPVEKTGTYTVCMCLHRINEISICNSLSLTIHRPKANCHVKCSIFILESPEQVYEQDITTSTKNYFKKVLAPLQKPIVQEYQVLTILDSYVNYTMDKAGWWKIGDASGQ